MMATRSLTQTRTLSWKPSGSLQTVAPRDQTRNESYFPLGFAFTAASLGLASFSMAVADEKKRGKDICGRKLSPEEIASQLSQRLGNTWELKADGMSIYRKFMFKNFLQAFEWMTAAAIVAEEMDHHPEWFNVYNRVEVTMNTHTCGGVSMKDIEFAIAVNTLFESIKNKQ